MLGIAYYSLFLVMGVLYADKIFKEKNIYFKLWSGGVIANIVLMFGIIPFALLLDFTKLAHILLVVFTLVPYFFLKKDMHLNPKRPDMWAFLWGGIITLVIFVLFENHVLVKVDGGFASGQSTYGDTAMHLGFISSIAEQSHFPPEFNLLSGTRLSYPFLVDSLSSSLYLFGTDLRASLIVPSFVISCLTVMGFYYFADSLVGRKSALLAMILFFLGGGFGFIYFLGGAPQDFTRIFTEYYQTPTNLIEENIRWLNPICDMIIPQRTTMAGWCVLLFTLWLLIDAIKGEKTSTFVLLGLVAGSMPMIHTHSFLALGIISAFCVFVFFKDAKNKRKYIKNWTIYAFLAFALSIGQLTFWTFSHSVGNEQFLRFGFNWVNETDSYLWFWIKNWGITAVFLIPALLLENRFNKKFALGFIAIFVISELIIFQPNEYDNNKLFFVSYMLFVCFVSHFLTEAYKKLDNIKSRNFLACVIIFLGLFSGILSIGRELCSGGEYFIFSDEEVAFSEFVKESTDKDAVFITGNDHINPVCVLSGRTIYAGSELYVYFHGYGREMYSRYDCVKEIYESDSYEELMKNIAKTGDTDYIVVSDRERSTYRISDAVFDELNCVYDADGIRLFKAK